MLACTQELVCAAEEIPPTPLRCFPPVAMTPSSMIVDMNTIHWKDPAVRKTCGSCKKELISVYTPECTNNLLFQCCTYAHRHSWICKRCACAHQADKPNNIICVSCVEKMRKEELVPVRLQWNNIPLPIEIPPEIFQSRDSFKNFYREWDREVPAPTTEGDLITACGRDKFTWVGDEESTVGSDLPQEPLPSDAAQTESQAAFIGKVLEASELQQQKDKQKETAVGSDHPHNQTSRESTFIDDGTKDADTSDAIPEFTHPFQKLNISYACTFCGHLNAKRAQTCGNCHLCTNLDESLHMMTRDELVNELASIEQIVGISWRGNNADNWTQKSWHGFRNASTQERRNLIKKYKKSTIELGFRGIADRYVNSYVRGRPEGEQWQEKESWHTLEYAKQQDIRALDLIDEMEKERAASLARGEYSMGCMRKYIRYEKFGPHAKKRKMVLNDVEHPAAKTARQMAAEIRTRLQEPHMVEEGRRAAAERQAARQDPRSNSRMSWQADSRTSDAARWRSWGWQSGDSWSNWWQSGWQSRGWNW